MDTYADHKQAVDLLMPVLQAANGGWAEEFQAGRPEAWADEFGTAQDSQLQQLWDEQQVSGLVAPLCSCHGDGQVTRGPPSLHCCTCSSGLCFIISLQKATTRSEIL